MSSTLITRLRKCSISYHSSLKLLAKRYSSVVDEKIEIPKRIPRGPTDILRALESTISKDPTAPHYKYHDDPYLIPMSNSEKRVYALAQEAGRKAALWVRQENAELFQHKEADPPVEKFFPKCVYNEKSEVTEDDLKKVISDVQVSDAITVYKLLKERNIPISNELMQSLLELLCFYNSEDSLPDDLIEERWFRQSNKGKERIRKLWKDGEFAEEIFISIEKPNAEAYSAIIQGMVKYYQVDRAWQLFEEAQQKGIIVNTDAYNVIINVANFLKEGYEMRWSLVVDLLTQMKKAGLKPNLGTLNAVLFILSTMGGSRATKMKALQTLSEFKSIGIEPSLASWHFVLNTFSKERGPPSTILNDIMNEIENKEHTIRDLRDVNFFATAMEVCRNQLKDCDLAKRVDKLLNFGNNYDLIGDSFKESVYYRHYFMLLCASEPIDEFMNIYYNKYVPHIYIPEPSVMDEILSQVEINETVEYLPKLWSDMIIFDHDLRENLLQKILRIMTDSKSEKEAELNPKFAKIALDIYNQIEKQNEARSNKISLSGDMVGNILILLLRNKDFDNACRIMEKLNKGEGTIIGVPHIDALSMFIDACIEEKAPSKAVMCLQYCAENGLAEVSDLAAHLNQKLTLDERYLDTLSQIIGKPVTLLKENV